MAWMVRYKHHNEMFLVLRVLSEVVGLSLFCAGSFSNYVQSRMHGKTESLSEAYFLLPLHSAHIYLFGCDGAGAREPLLYRLFAKVGDTF